MSKVLITADLHIHPHRNDNRRIEDGLECLEWIYETAEIAGINKVIIAGDFLHHRFSLNSYAYSKACDLVSLANEKGIDTIFVLGNHDCYYEDNWSVHSLSPMREMAVIIDKPTTLELNGVPVDFLPYTPHPSKYLRQFDGKARILISHLAVADAVLNAKYDIKSVEDDSKEKEVISASAFKHEKVWLGHYHYGQKVSDVVEYIGSPMQLSYGEAGQVKHIAIFDLETLETTYVENNVSPKFHIVENVEELPENLDQSYIQLRSKSEPDFDLRKKLSQSGARDIEFQPIRNLDAVNAQTTTVLNDISAFFVDKRKLVDEYANNMKPEGLNLEQLKKVGQHLISQLEN